MMLGSSTIIQDIEGMWKSGLASLTFYYDDFREDQKKKNLRAALIRSDPALRPV